MAASGKNLDQSIIDHEVRLGRMEAGLERVRASRQARDETRRAAAEARWFREQYVAMLRSAASEEELQGLGLSDEMIREARLGDSLLEAWKALRPPPVFTRVTGRTRGAE